MFGDTELGGKEPELATVSEHAPNPKRVAAGKRNQARWRGFTADGLRRLRESALRHRPWMHSTGPRTVAGKVKAAANGKTRQKGKKSVRQIRAEMTILRELLEDMRETSRVLRTLSIP
jgi:hypothetical protein